MLLNARIPLSALLSNYPMSNFECHYLLSDHCQRYCHLHSKRIYLPKALPVIISKKNWRISFLQNSIACLVHKTNDAPGTVLWQISKWRPRLHAFLQTKWIFQLYIILTLWNMRLRQGSLDLVITRSSDKFGVSVSSDLTLSFMHISHKTWITFKIYFHE